ncbi:MAG: type I secretion system permease/ATPase, partial [Synechococcaceae bacterium WBB_10_009]|nr:type I secretion system permease/ATPase [Synechococcaceae bacterium WBB_10_009]
MQLTLALRVMRAWEPFSQLPEERLAPLAESLQALQLRPGQKLFDYTALPPGVALVAKGQLRLLSLDEREEPFTLQRIGAGEMVGHISLMRGVTGQAVAAALPSQLWLMPQAVFLEVLSAEEGLQRALAQPNLEELFAVAAASPSPRTPSRTVLRDWASHQLSEAAAQQQVLVIPPGEHSFGPEWGPWLLSSSNVDGFVPGEELLGPLRLRVRGKLPARLLSKGAATPPAQMPAALVVAADAGAQDPQPTEAELLEPDWQESSTAIVAVEQQHQALEDWYGRLGDDGSFPHLSGAGPVETPMACLRMLARQFDLPFRRDVLKRILEDQLARDSEGKGIGLLQLAAISDLLGLRASPMSVNEAQIVRLPMPALALGRDGPVVLWSVDASGQLLVGDPVSGQGLIQPRALQGWSEEGE